MKELKFSKGDIFGGLTAGIVALPLALAFGVQSGLGAAAGCMVLFSLDFLLLYLEAHPLKLAGRLVQ